MYYSQSIQACLQEIIGSPGVSSSEISDYSGALSEGLGKLHSSYRDGSLPLLRLPEERDDLDRMTAIANAFRERFDDVVVLGTGGSSLGAQALYALKGQAGKGRPGTDGSPRLHVLSSVDPFGFCGALNDMQVAKTGWVVVSKSGGTAETMMQFMSILPKLRAELGDSRLKDHVVVITEPGDRPLRRLAREFDIPILDHDPDLGGRYSVLSAVGLLPALIAGLNARAVRAGAHSVISNMLRVCEGDGDPLDFAPALGAAMSVALNEKRGLTSSVMLAYGDRLGPFGLWYRQLWAESLGKGGKGTTPIDAVGPVDQHSQLQLWLDGPNDKMFTIVGSSSTEPSCSLNGYPSLPAIQADIAEVAGLSYLADRTLGDLLRAAHKATAETLAEKGRPVRRIDLDAVDEEGVGAIMMHFMLETILAAHLLDVDPFDQPAVERGKVLTRAYLKGA